MGRQPLGAREAARNSSNGGQQRCTRIKPPPKHKQAVKLVSIQSLAHSYTAKQYNIPNEITNKQVQDNLQTLIDKVLSPVQNKFGQIYIVSGYRGEALNHHVNGVSNSQHTKGQAVDFYIPHYSLYEIAKWMESNLVYDQLIIEEPAVGDQSWIHVSYNPNITKNRNEEMIMTNGHYIKGLENLYRYAGSTNYYEPYLPDNLDTKTIRAMLYAVSKLESAHGTKPFGVETWYMGSMDKALGFYHIMGNNVGEWTQRYLGKRLTKDQFLNSPEYQHTLMATKFKQELNREHKRGYSTDIAVQRIFSIHFSGTPNYKAMTRDANSTSTKTYTSIVYNNYLSYLNHNGEG
jgi:hypothetical protein